MAQEPDLPTRTPPFIVVIFILIALPFAFVVYSFRRSFHSRQLQRELLRRAFEAESNPLDPAQARPKLWDVWSPGPAGSYAQSCNTLESWNSIQPLWAKVELMPAIHQGKTVLGSSTATSGARTGRGNGHHLLARNRGGRLWRFFGPNGPARSSSQVEVSALSIPKPGDSILEGLGRGEGREKDVGKQDEDYEYELHIAVVVVLPSPPRAGLGGGNSDTQKEDNMKRQVDFSTGYCIGTASCPIRMNAG